MEQKGLEKNIILSTFYQVLGIITPLITAPYVSRVLGPYGIGIYSFTNSIQMYFSLFAALGTLSYGSREIARNRNDKKTYSKLFWEIELLSVVTSVVCIVAWLVWCYFNEKYQTYYLILTISLIATMADISWFYSGMERFKHIVLQNSIFKLIGVVAIFLFVKTQDDIGVYIFIMAFSHFLGNLSMWVYLPQYIEKVKFSELRISNHFRETIIYFVPTIATSIYTILDKTLIGVITQSEAENGFYEQATKIINTAKAFTFAGLNSVLGSRISWLFSEKKYSEIKKRIGISMDYILFIGIPICFGILAVADRFIPIFFGKGYEQAAYLLKLMSPLVIIIGVSSCLGSQYYNPAGLRTLSAKFIIIGSCVNFVLNVVLIPFFKSEGAAVATIIAESVISFLYLKNCNGYEYFSNFASKSWKKIIAALIMFICIRIIDKYISSDFIAVFIEILIGVVIYIAISVIIKDSFLKSLFSQGKFQQLKNKFL